MRRLLLLRHAKSDRSLPGAADRERPLNARGRAAAPLMGAYMERHRLVPDRAAISPAERTRETWTLLSQAFTRAPVVSFEERLYGGGPEEILDVIRQTPDKTQSLLVVGHNPGLHVLALALVGAGDIEARQRLNEKFPTTGLAVIDFAAASWGKLHGHSGRLAHFLSPRTLEAVPD